MIALSPESVADLRACAEKYGAAAVLAEARRRRQQFLDPQLSLPGHDSLDAPGVISAIAEKVGSRLEQRLPPELVAPPPQLRSVLMAERVRWVAKAVRQLPLPEKRVIRLRYWDELPLRTVGAMMGFTASRAAQVHQQALGRLRQWFYLNWFVDGGM